MTTPTEINKEKAEAILSKVDIEGFDYWLENYSSDLDGTVLEELRDNALKAQANLKDELEILRQRFDIEES